MSNPYLICSDRELRTLATQWLLAERWEKAGSLLSDLNFAEAKTGRIGIDELLQDYTTAFRLLPQDSSWLEKLKSINKVLDRQAYGLREWNAQEQPTFFLQQIRNEAFAQGLNHWQVQAEAELANLGKPYLLTRFPVHSDPAELRTLIHSNSIELTPSLIPGYYKVNCVALSADGRLAVSASENRTLKVWDVATGRELHTLKGHSNRVYPLAVDVDNQYVAPTRERDESMRCVALSVDGRLAISGTGDGTLQVWDVPTGRELRTFEHGQSGVNDIALSSDGRLAVSAGGDHTLKVWDVATGRELRTLIGHKAAVGRVALSADGRLAVSAVHENESSPDKSTKVWDIATGRELRTLVDDGFSFGDVALSADGRLAVSVSGYQTLKVWDMATGRELRTINDMSSVALSADGQLAVSMSNNSTSFNVWEVATGRVLHTFNERKFLNSVTLSADGRLAISVSEDVIKVWDISVALNVTGPELRTFRGHGGTVNSVALSADGRLAVSASAGNLKVWDVAKGRELRTIRHNAEKVALSADGRLAISVSREQKKKGGYKSTIKVWDIPTGRELRTLKGHSQKVNDIALSADGRLAVSVSDDKTLKVWDVRTGRELRIMGHGDVVESVALSADGRLAISVSAEDTESKYRNYTTAKVWDVETGSKLHAFLGPDRTELSTDGRLIVSKSNNNIGVWEVSTGRHLRNLSGHKSFLNNVALSVDGRRGVSVSNDRTLKVWDISAALNVGVTSKYETSEFCIATLPLGISSKCCAISAYGKTIVAGDERGEIYFLELVGADELLAKDVKIEPSWLALENEPEEKVEARSPRLPRWLKGLLGRKD